MFGGYDGQRCFNDIDVLDLDTGRQPKTEGSTPQARNAHTMTQLPGKLYLFGGHSGNKHLRDLHVLGAEASPMRWSTPEVSGVPPPGLRGHSATLIGNTVFMFGGIE